MMVIRQKMISLSFSLSLCVPAVRVQGHPSHPLLGVASVCRNVCTSIIKRKEKGNSTASALLKKEKRRTRSHREYDAESINQLSHVPVLLGEVLDVFSSNYKPISSFVDCTLGAAGHSSAVIQSHPQLKIFIGMDVDPGALDMARNHISALSSSLPRSDFKAFTFLKNFKHIKSIVGEVDKKMLDSGVDGILMDLGMSSMQVNNPERGFSVLHNGPLDMRMDLEVAANGRSSIFKYGPSKSPSCLRRHGFGSIIIPNEILDTEVETELNIGMPASLKAEDILNSWPDSEVGRILREYGEESNWRLLLNKILQARLHGGLHSTGELVDLIRNITHGTRNGRQGWIKTATRVFQALRIAVNDELNTLSDTLVAAFDCLAPGGRLAVISFHSLEDRIVKQTFLKIIDCDMENGYGYEDRGRRHFIKMRSDEVEDGKESWIKQTVQGLKGTILTKRPITPSEDEERLNRRSRSAKLRVIQKVVS